jgi:uncharacterized RDD family membrane protein YckC
MAPDNPSMGVYYSADDYIGVAKRLMIEVVDVPVAFMLSAAVIWIVRRLEEDISTDGVLLLCALVWFGYFVLLKRSTYRTLGYIIAGARIVDLYGRRPSVFRLLARVLFAALGPFNFLMDLFWLTGDRDRQALRDKLVATYVIRRHAIPIGSGKIVMKTYMFWGMTFLFKEVARAA